MTRRLRRPATPYRRHPGLWSSLRLGCSWLLLLTLLGCTHHPAGGGAEHRLLGSVPSGAKGVFVAEQIAVLADRVAQAGPGSSPDAGLAQQLRAVGPEEAFVYGFSYDGCTRSDPDLVVVSRGVVEARTVDLNRECYRAMPVTAYFSVPWSEVGDSFVIGVPGDRHPAKVTDRQVR